MSKGTETKLDNSELTFDEMIRARQVFLHHTDEYVTSEFDLRTILSELGQYPSDGELKFCVEAFDGKMGFNGFTTYLSFLKRRFKRPEPRDLDTLRAFVALGGGHDRRGDINAENLRNACRHFDLTIDIDAMIKEVDTDNSGKLEFEEFRSMWGATTEAASSSRRGSAQSDIGAAMAAVLAAQSRAAGTISPTQPDGAEEETEEDHIEALRQFLFPQAARSTLSADGGRGGRKQTNKRASTMLVPKAPIGANFGNKDEAGGANALAQSTMAQSQAAAKHDSDSDEVETPSYQNRNQYRPPSPVILSMRNSGRQSKATPRTLTPRKGTKPMSPRSTQRTVSPRTTSRK